MLFAQGLVLEREPLQWSEFPTLLQEWIQNAGGVAALGIGLFALAWTWQNSGQARRPRSGFARGFVVLSGIAGVLYAILALTYLATGTGSLANLLATVAGAAAVLAAVFPIALPLFTSMRWRRIWALARLSLKEAVRKRVVMVFGAMALVFLFADWFVPYKREDQVRNYVRVVYWSMAPLFLMTASLLGAFSIPTDVKNQSIHTIVTKPVERFEIVLGRFIGYGLILTVGLAFLSALSLVYVVRGVTPEAAQESYKARVPIFGRMAFYGTEGESVGREWDYRKYIGGENKQYAHWMFDSLPGNLADPERWVSLEFTFDIFRLTKGEENKDIPCTFTFADGGLSVPQVEQVLAAAAKERLALQTEVASQEAKKRKAGESPQAIQQWREQEYSGLEKTLLLKYGVYQKPGFEVTDYHTQSLEVPGTLFKKVLETERPKTADGQSTPVFQVLVNVDRISILQTTQRLGVAKRDLYILAAERPFWVNFLKGIIGMWFTFLLVLGLAVACSTYLSGVISWLCTWFLYSAGMFTEYINQLAQNRAVGGGPMESAFRLFTRQPIGVPLEPTPTTSLFTGFDEIYRWLLRRLLSIIPDVNRFDLHHYVANGFDISWTQVLFLDNLLPLLAYLIPWGVLAFYLMKFREIANPT